MKQSNRILIIFGLVILVATIVTTISVLLVNANHRVQLLPENTPEGTIQRFFIALDNEDYLSAYQDILPSAKSDTFDMWVSPIVTYGERPAFRVSLESSSSSGDSATVQVIVETYRPGSPFNSRVSTNHILFSLQYQDGKWWVASPSDVWWLIY